MSIAYNIVGYHRDEKDYIKIRIETKKEREKNPYNINFRIVYKQEFEKIKNDINKFNRMLNNLYFLNIIDYEEYKKYNYCKLSELINYICGLIKDEEKFINIKENIKNFEVYKLILSYDKIEDIIKKINNFYDIYKQIEIPIKNI